MDESLEEKIGKKLEDSDVPALKKISAKNVFNQYIDNIINKYNTITYIYAKKIKFSIGGNSTYQFFVPLRL